jgi:RNA polymerase sigma-70 factor, ECF subfamily
LDKWLIRKARAGDRGALERIIANHYSSVYRFLLHLTRREEDASDLTQEVFAKLSKSLETWRSEGSFRGWLFRVAYREFLHFQRDQGPAMDALSEAFLSRSESPDDAITLLNAIETLDEELRTAFWLREVERLSVKEISESLGIPEGTVKSRTHVAKQRLRAKLRTAWSPHSEPMETDHVV